MDHDQLFKEVLHECFVDFLELFLPQVLQYVDVNSIEFVEQESHSEITERSKTAVDLLAKARFKGKPTFFLIHVEAQADKRRWSGKRMFYYFAIQAHKHDLPVYPIALLSWDKPFEPDSGVYAVDFPDRRVLEFNYVAIQLNRLNWREFRNRDNLAASALMAKMGVEPHERPKVRAACLKTLARIRPKGRKLQSVMRFIDGYLPLTPNQEEELNKEVTGFHPQERKVVMEYITSWERKGREIGKIEGKIEAAVRLLTRKLGQLSLATNKKLKKLPSEQVEALLDDLLEFESKADLHSWLRANAQQATTN